MSRLHLSDDTLRDAVGAIGIIVLLQRGTEDPGKRLVESGTDRTKERLDEVIGRVVALAVNKFDEKFTLRIGELLHTWRIFPFDVLLHLLHVSIFRLLVRQHLEILACLNNDPVTLLGDRQGEARTGFYPVCRTEQYLGLSTACV